MKSFGFLLILFAFFHSSPALAGDTIAIKTGLIAGLRRDDMMVFKGIPFAAPPVGPLRWKEPQPALSWQGVRECYQFGPSPMQASPEPFSMWSEEFLIPKEPISEDCLYLNIWAKAGNKKMPVVVWIYGGGFMSGGSACPIYDGEAYAKEGVVFVSINYRVGIFGLFAHPELSAESGKNASGNYGLLDQIAALQWVQNNIASFGGDPSNVTIAGQSAGSMSVSCLVASPLAKGLFNKAIAESGASFSKMMPLKKDAEAEGVRILELVKVSGINDLRRIPADSLLKIRAGFITPIVDGYVLPESIAAIFSGNRQNAVALLTGWNQDEGLLFGPALTGEQFIKESLKQYGDQANQFLKYYPSTSDSVAATSQLALSRDRIFGSQNYQWASIASKASLPVYVYRFARKVPGTGEYAKYGAFHTGEVPYAYNNLRFVHRPFTNDDERLARTMSAYWLNFIRNGNPNGKGLAAWPRFSASEKNILYFDTQIKAGPMKDWKQLEFLVDPAGR